MMRILINCDDLGASREINDAIFELMEQRRVTSATLMMNAPETEDALQRMRLHPGCSFGIHLNSTEFTPLTSHPGLDPLLNEQGEFEKKLKHYPLTAVNREAIYGEWCAQIDRAIAAGFAFSHIDSHEYIHTIPRLFGVLKRVQRKYRIRKIRITPNLFAPAEYKSLSLRAYKCAWNFALRHYVPTVTTDRFGAFYAFYQRVRQGLRLHGSVELMVHPGRKNFAEETDLLREDWKDTLPKDARLINYNEL